MTVLPPAPPAAARRQAPATKTAELQAITDSWAWASGYDPVRADGAELLALIKRADTEERLRMIARVRGYPRRWVQHILRARANGLMVAG